MSTTGYTGRMCSGHVISNYWETTNISEMVQDTDIHAVAMENQKEIICGLSNGTNNLQ